jgi:hypothetical protein
MLELLLLANFVILVLIYLQLRKNIKETDSYFAAIDLSLRQFFANISNAEEESVSKRHDEILRQLEKLSIHSSATVRILNEVHNPRSVEDEYYEAKQSSKWLP